jgi:GNAT superfamily N-acetyltransferase
LEVATLAETGASIRRHEVARTVAAGNDGFLYCGRTRCVSAGGRGSDRAHLELMRSSAMSRSPDEPKPAVPAATQSTSAAVRIVPFDPARPDHHAAFRDLNLAWIEAHFTLEARDRHELDDPQGHILAAGGQIFMAEVDGGAGPGAGEVLGTCALLAEPDGACELAKMAVSETARGRGVGRALGEAAVAAARALGAPRIDLLSNTVLAPAIALYRALGFVEVPLPPSDYARANIKMVLALSAHPSGVPGHAGLAR